MIDWKKNGAAHIANIGAFRITIVFNHISYPGKVLVRYYPDVVREYVACDAEGCTDEMLRPIKIAAVGKLIVVLSSAIAAMGNGDAGRSSGQSGADGSPYGGGGGGGGGG